jgi:hypothetical protein
MKALVKVLKVITAKTVFYVVSGRVTLAKCAKSGRFVSRNDAQWLFDNLANLAVPAEKKAQAYRGTYKDNCLFFIEFNKAVAFFGITVFCESTKNKLLNSLRAIAFHIAY